MTGDYLLLNTHGISPLCANDSVQDNSFAGTATGNADVEVGTGCAHPFIADNRMFDDFTNLLLTGTVNYPTVIGNETREGIGVSFYEQHSLLRS